MLKNEPFLFKGEQDTACLLLHGLGGGVYEMQLLGDYLFKTHGLTVQGISYPGHDQHAAAMPASTWREWYRHIEETYQCLAQTHDSVSIVGFSTGCPLGLHLAAAYPLEKLVLLCPYLALRHQWYYLLPLEAWLFSLGWLLPDLPWWHLPLRDASMRQLAEAIVFYRTFNLAAVRSAIELINQVKGELPQIQTPTLIMQACQDSIVDPAGAEIIYQRLGSTTKRLHWLSQSDHIVPLDVEREEVFREVGSFLTTTLPQSPGR
jgi:carboxylesterase